MARWMWLIAGPNGAGKSSFTDQFLADLGHRDLIRLNADDRTVELRQQSPDAAQSELNLRAAIEIDREVEDLIKAKRSFVVETVLSSRKYRDDVQAAKRAGFRFGLIYISLYPPELSPLRVAERTAKGGHDVEAARAIERHHRSHMELRWFAPRADILMVFDNSAPHGTPVLVATRTSRKPLRHLRRGLNPAIDAALSAAFPAKLAPA
jgi:predicted ABC-type ATPase